ncbi:MAG: DUF1499 domain-containing protein [Pseudomonadota bacterium]
MTDFINFKSVKRPPKPNTCLAAPDNFTLASEADFAPPVFEMSADDLFGKLSAIVEAERSWSKLETDAGQRKLKFVATTGLLRFKDDVDVEIVPLESGQSTLAIYSRSRVGYSDLGTNRKRVNDLIGRVTTN